MTRTTSAPPGAGWSPLTLALLAALWLAGAANWPLWRALVALPETASWRGALFVAGFAAMIATVVFALLSFAAWPRTIKPAIALFLVPAAVGAHFMGSYGVVIDPTMMVNVLQTNARETRDLLNLRLLTSVLLIAALPLAWLWRQPVSARAAPARLLRNVAALLGATAVLAALLIALFADLSATMRNHRSMRYLINPLNSFYALGSLAHQAQAAPKGPPQPIGVDASLRPRPAGARPPLLILVVGETARSDHFSLNGYARPTNPELSSLDVVSFREVQSCGTNTAASLPCMFSHLGREAYQNRERDHENLLDLAQRAGLAVLWLDNQSGCKGLCERVPSAMATDGAPAALCSDGECSDEALLHGLDARIDALPADRRTRGVLLVMHQMGSHGPAYWKRSLPQRKPFQPECTTNVLQQCDRQALVNAYDNSIVATDHLLSLAIAWLRGQQPRYDPALLYVSDHGESLGENGLYLHGLPWAVAPREQTHVPMVAWLAAQAEQSSSVHMTCLRERRDLPLSHDHLFHTALGLLGVQAAEYKPGLDAFAACREP